VVNWFHRRRLDQSPLGKYGVEFATRIRLMVMTCRKCAKSCNSSHARNSSGISNMLWHTLPSLPLGVLAFDANSSNRPLEIHHERIDFHLRPQESNLMPTPARVPEQVSASVPERRSFLRGTASDPNDFVKGMSIAISTAERIR
jgi:hypothetical protein